MLNIAKDKIYIISKKYGQRLGFDLPYFIKNGFWVFLRQGIGSICGLALSIAFARLATQEVFGQYQFVLSLLSIISILSIPGLNTAITQSVARGYDGDYKKVVKISFLWSLLGIPTLLIIGGYYYIFQSHPLGIALMISSIFFPFFYAPNTWDAFLQGKSRFDISTKYSSIQAILNTLATVTIIFFSANNLIPIVVMYFISYTFFNGCYYFRSLKYIENNRNDPNVYKFGNFLNKINILILISNNIDKVLIGVLISNEMLAVYTVISLIAMKIKGMSQPIINIFFPKLSQSDYSIKELFRKKKKIIIILIILNFALSLIFMLVSEKISYLFFGNNYSEYYYLSKYFSIMVFISPFLFFLGIFAQAKKYTKLILNINIFQNISWIFLNIILIYRFGLFGAVLSINISYAVWFLLYLFFLRRNTTR